MRILGVYYTNNKVKREVMLASINSIQHAANYSRLKGVNHVGLACSSWEVIPEWQGVPYISKYKNNGHLNIVLQILQVLYPSKAAGYDLVCCLEHDVMYAPGYFEMVAERSLRATVMVTNLDYIGMNELGYVKQNTEKFGTQRCLSQLTMPFDYALQWFESKIEDCVKQGWCFLEPGYDPAAPPPKLETNFYAFKGDSPNVHINMNHTDSNHHLTSHPDTYLREPFAQDHPVWGNFRKYNIF